jgi:hypothetical protein
VSPGPRISDRIDDDQPNRTATSSLAETQSTPYCTVPYEYEYSTSTEYCSVSPTFPSLNRDCAASRTKHISPSPNSR